MPLPHPGLLTTELSHMLLLLFEKYEGFSPRLMAKSSKNCVEDSNSTMWKEDY
jgi:hypothetical protein